MNTECQIANDYKNGMTWHQLMNKYAISNRKIKRILRDFNIETNKNLPKISSDKFNDIINLYQSGKTTRQIAKIYGCDKKLVSIALKKMNIKLRDGGESHRKYTINHHCFDDANNLDVQYWLGFIAADGNLWKKESARYGVLTITLSIVDDQHIRKFRNFLETDRPPCYTFPKKGGRQVTIQINSEKIYNKLLEYGLTPRKSITCDVNSLFYNSHEFWRGAIDGDGCISIDKRNSYPSISFVGSKQMCDALIKFVRLNYSFNGLIFPDGKVWRVIISNGKIIQQILSDLYINANTYLERKRDKSLLIINKKIRSYNYHK